MLITILREKAGHFVTLLEDGQQPLDILASATDEWRYIAGKAIRQSTSLGDNKIIPNHCILPKIGIATWLCR